MSLILEYPDVVAFCVTHVCGAHARTHTHTHTHTHTQVLRILEDEGKAALLQVAGGEISGVKFVAV